MICNNCGTLFISRDTEELCDICEDIDEYDKASEWFEKVYLEKKTKAELIDYITVCLEGEHVLQEYQYHKEKEM